MLTLLRFRWVLLLALGTAAAPARASGPPEQPARPLRPAAGGTGALLAAGYHAGFWAGGMNNISAYALQVNRTGSSVSQRLAWNDLFHGVYIRASYLDLDDKMWASLGWSNRHSIAETRYTAANGDQLRTEYRVRLNEVSMELGRPLWHAHLRPGLGADLGFFRVSSRTSKDDEKAGAWHSAHAETKGGGFLDPGAFQPTAGLTLFCDVVPFSQRGAGLTLRPYYQWHLIQPDLFGRAGTFDSNSYQYRANNYGLALSWAFSSL